MQRVTLVFQKSYLEYPTIKDVFSRDFEFELPSGFEVVHLAAARVYDHRATEATASVANPILNTPSGDTNAVIINYRDTSNLLGKMLTYVDATYSDAEQRKAHKDIVRDMIYAWEREIRERAVQTVDAHIKVKN